MQDTDAPLRPVLITALALTAALLALTACAPRPVAEGEEKPFVVADVFATPGKALATIALSPTPEPTATIPNFPSPTPAPTRPLPTAVILQQPTMPIGTAGPTPSLPADAVFNVTPTLACSVPPPFAAAWATAPQAAAMLGCPAGSPQTVSGVFQFYEHGAMFWRQEDRSIFVISDLAIEQGQESDTWWRLDDTYQEDEEEGDTGLQPPEGLIQPVRGFGKVWRNNAFIREALGWATTPETPLDSQWLQFEGGWMMTGPGGSPIYALIPLDAPPYTSGVHFGALPR